MIGYINLVYCLLLFSLHAFTLQCFTAQYSHLCSYIYKLFHFKIIIACPYSVKTKFKYFGSSITNIYNALFISVYVVHYYIVFFIMVCHVIHKTYNSLFISVYVVHYFVVYFIMICQVMHKTEQYLYQIVVLIMGSLSA